MKHCVWVCINVRERERKKTIKTSLQVLSDTISIVVQQLAVYVHFTLEFLSLGTFFESIAALIWS